MHCLEWTSHVSVHANLKVPVQLLVKRRTEIVSKMSQPTFRKTKELLKVKQRSAHTMNMTDKERGQNIQFLILPSTLAVVDKGTSLHCYYVKMCRTGVTCIFTWSTSRNTKLQTIQTLLINCVTD